MRGGGGRTWLGPLFIVIAGMDIVTYWFYNAFQFPPLGNNIEAAIGEEFFHYWGMGTHVFQLPQHALPAWLSAALFWKLRNEEGFYRNCCLLGVCVAWWSAFSALGLALLIMAWCLLHPQYIPKLFSPVRQGFGILLAVPLLLYYTSTNFAAPSGWFIAELTEKGHWLQWFGLVLAEFGIVAAAAIPLASPAHRRMLVVIAVLLILLPVYRVGQFHDVAGQGSQSALFVFWCLVLRSCFHGRPRITHSLRNRLVIVIAVCISLGAVNALVFARNTLSDYSISITKSELTAAMGGALLAQFYLGRTDSFFFRHLSSADEDPDNPEWLHQGASHFVLLGRAEEALNMYGQAIDLNPENQKLHYDKGVLLLKLGRTDEGVESMRQAHDIDPTYMTRYAARYRKYGWLAWITELNYFLTIVEPDNPQNFYELGHGLLIRGNYAGAEQSFRRVLQLSPNYPRAATLHRYAQEQARQAQTTPE